MLLLQFFFPVTRHTSDILGIAAFSERQYSDVQRVGILQSSFFCSLGEDPSRITFARNSVVAVGTITREVCRLKSFGGLIF